VITVSRFRPLKLCVLTAYLGVALLFMSVLPLRAEVPELEDYYRKPELRQVALSPDGNKLAGISRIASGKYRLVVYDLEDRSKVIAVVDETEDEHIIGVRWFNDLRLGVTLMGVTEAGNLELPYRRMLAMDANGQNVVNLLSDAKRLRGNFDLGQVASTLPEDPDHIVMAAWDGGATLYRTNINTGSASKIAQGIVATVGFKLNKAGEANLRIDLNQVTRRISIMALNPEKKKWKKVLSYRPGELDEGLGKEIANFEVDNNILLLERLDGDEYTKLHRYDLKRETYTDVVHEVDGYDILNTIANVHTGEVIGIRYLADRPHRVFFSPEHQRVQSYLEGLFPNGEVNVAFTLSGGQTRFLFFTNEPSRPGIIGLYDQSSNRIVRVGNLAPQLEGTSTSVSKITYQAADDTRIHGYLTRLAGTEESKLPLVVLPHGGPHARDWVSYNPVVQYLATRGYAVFQPNFRGSLGYGRKFEDAGNHEYGDLMIDDIRRGVESLIERGRVDPDAICAVGYSYGGYASLMLAAESDLLNCVVSINAPVDWELRIKHKLRGISDKEMRQELRSWFDDTIGNIDTQEEMLLGQSALHRAAEVKAAVLLIHAQDDSNVNVRHSNKMHKALKKADKEVSYVKLRRGGHSLQRDDANKKVLKEMVLFLSTHIR
jgi:dienelactone hydrolase